MIKYLVPSQNCLVSKIPLRLVVLETRKIMTVRSTVKGHVALLKRPEVLNVMCRKEVIFLSDLKTKEYTQLAKPTLTRLVPQI